MEKLSEEDIILIEKEICPSCHVESTQKCLTRPSRAIRKERYPHKARIEAAEVGQ